VVGVMCLCVRVRAFVCACVCACVFGVMLGGSLYMRTRAVFVSARLWGVYLYMYVGVWVCSW